MVMLFAAFRTVEPLKNGSRQGVWYTGAMTAVTDVPLYPGIASLSIVDIVKSRIRGLLLYIKAMGILVVSPRDVNCLYLHDENLQSSD